MGKSIQICNRRFISYPYPFLACVFKAGIVTFTFCAEGIIAFKVFTVSVDGKPYAIRNGYILCTAAVLLAIIEIFVMAWAVGIFGCFQRTTEFLSGYNRCQKIYRLSTWQVRLRKQDFPAEQVWDFWCCVYLRG